MAEEHPEVDPSVEAAREAVHRVLDDWTNDRATDPLSVKKGLVAFEAAIRASVLKEMSAGWPALMLPFALDDETMRKLYNYSMRVYQMGRADALADGGVQEPR